MFEELAKADASVAWCVWNGNTHWIAAQLSPEAARAIHGDPDVITANCTRPSGQAHVVGGGYQRAAAGHLSAAVSWHPGWCCGRSCTTAANRTCWHRAPPDIRFMLLPARQCEILDT